MNNEASKCWTIEARWEKTREPITEVRYFAIEEVGGSIESAKASAQTYLHDYVSRNGPRLEWTAGFFGHRRAYYASHPAITFRITG